MNYNENVKEILNNHNIRIGLNSTEEYKADFHGSNENQYIAGYYLPAKVEESLPADARPAQEYFYRAMNYGEAAQWVAAWTKQNPVMELQAVLTDRNNGIHFATGAAYSKRYITRQSNEAVLLEFYSPKLVKSFEKIGVGRKNESNGEMSYGIGFQETITLAPTNEISSKVRQKYNKYKDSETVVKLREWWNIAENCSLDEQRKLLKVFYFLKKLESIRIVYIKNS